MTESPGGGAQVENDRIVGYFVLGRDLLIRTMG